MSISTYGDFDFQTVVDAYEPKLADLQPHHERHGLSLQVQYFYGGLQDSDGVMWAVERKFIGPMTGGLWVDERLERRPEPASRHADVLAR